MQSLVTTATTPSNGSPAVALNTVMSLARAAAGHTTKAAAMATSSRATADRLKCCECIVVYHPRYGGRLR